MNSALKWKLIAGFLLVFLAGVATGIFGTMAVGHRFIFGHHHGMVAQRMKSHLQRQLRLTDDQLTKVSPIIENSGAQLEQIRGETGKRVREIIAQSHRDISQYLTPEQQERLTKMEQRHRRWMHHGHWRGHETASPEASPE